MAANTCYPNNRPGRGCKQPRRSLKSIQQLPHIYQLEWGKIVEDENRWWRADHLSFQEIIERAVASKRKDGEHEPHQRRLAKQVYPRSKDALLAVQDELKTAKEFDTLHGVVDKALRHIEGVGDLFVYDIADRIALYLGRAPTSVYLHAGTRIGAKALLPKISNRWRTIEINELPAPLRKMSARDLENALCIYADDLKKLSAPRRRKQNGRD